MKKRTIFDSMTFDDARPESGAGPLQSPNAHAPTDAEIAEDIRSEVADWIEGKSEIEIRDYVADLRTTKAEYDLSGCDDQAHWIALEIRAVCDFAKL